MPLEGYGPMAVAIMWLLTFLTFIFVLLRLYTRLVVVDSFGIDDTTYLIAFGCLVLYTIFITIAASYGFGSISPNDAYAAILYEAIGLSFSVLGMAIAKCALGFFLLRVAQEKWQLAVVWANMILLICSSIACLFCFWLQCQPYTFPWERLGENRCMVPQLGVSILLATACVFTDIFFAIFPWIVFWRLQMPSREKYVVLGSMSLGIIAAAFGIKRATEIPELWSHNYLESTVPIVLWSAAEMTVTLICIGVPILRPLYKRRLNKLIAPKDDNILQEGPFPLRTVGGSPIVIPGLKKHNKSKSRTEKMGETEDRERKIGLKGPFNVAFVVGGRKSDEELLVGQPALRALEDEKAEREAMGGIFVVDEVAVTSARLTR